MIVRLGKPHWYRVCPFSGWNDDPAISDDGRYVFFDALVA